jgi:hypothetical protein
VTEPPSQNVVGPDGVMVVLGSGSTRTATGVEEIEQPISSTTVTK